MQLRGSNRATALALLLGLAPWSGGCATGLSVRRVGGVGPGDGTANMVVRVFENRSDRTRGVATSREVVTALFRGHDGVSELVREEHGPRVAMEGLPPGEYWFSITCWNELAGHGRESHVERQSLSLQAGETAVVEVVMRDSESALVGVVALAAVLLMVDRGWAELGPESEIFFRF